jgi:vacuolar-type H+-ATPase subunit I/STV1
MAAPSRVAALAGLAVIAGYVFESLWTSAGSLSQTARNLLRLALAGAIVPWCIGVFLYAGYLSFAVSYYRLTAVVCLALAGAAGLLAIACLRNLPGKAVLACVALVVVGLKLGHWGYYVPEWNYRESQGPWGRAIGQWVPPNRTIYMTHEWQPDLCFAIGRPVRRIVDPALLASMPGISPKFVLLHEAEFEHWPEQSGKLLKVASFLDEFGSGRVLARTEGDFSWKQR